MSNKWDDKLTEKFLTLYRKHKCLWNPYSPNYKNCSVKKEAFKIVVQELNAPQIKISECLQQIEVIREKYKKEQIKAEKELKSGKIYESKIPWFHLMSEMLCEVINDEENFSARSPKIVPRTITKAEQNKDIGAPIGYEEFSNFLEKPEKYGGSKSNQNNFNIYVTSKAELDHFITGLNIPHDAQTQDNNLPCEPKTVNEANNPWNKCPSCRWEKEENQDKTYNRTNQFNKCVESGVQVEPEIEIPRQVNETKIMDTNTRIDEAKQPAQSPLCINEINYSNKKIMTPATDLMRNRKTVKINTDVELTQGDRGKCISSESKKCEVTEVKIPRRAENRVRCPRVDNDFEENIVTRPGHIDNNNQSQFSECLLQNLLMDQTLNEQSVRALEFEDEIDREKEISNRYSSYVQEYGKSSSKLATTSVEDKYEVCSRFKIIIPTSDREDQNLEITGYGVRVINPQLSKYILCPSSETSKIAISSKECACTKEFYVPIENVKRVDLAGYNSIIKLNINHKGSKKTRAKERLCTRQEADPEDAEVSELKVQHKLVSNRKTQTDSYYENGTIQIMRDVGTSQFDSSKSVRHQRGEMGVTSINENSRLATRGTTLNGNGTSMQQDQSTLNNVSEVSGNPSCCSARPQIEDSAVPVAPYNNTRLILNVIVKILESDDTGEISDNLQTTLDTMLDKFQQLSMSAQSAESSHIDNNQIDAIFNNSSLSTQYENLAPNSAPVNREARNINLQKLTNNTVDLVDTRTRNKAVDLVDTRTDVRPQSPILGASYYGEIAGDDASMFLLPGETNNAVNREANENIQNSRPLNETNKSMNSRSIRNRLPASILDNTFASNPAANSSLDYTNEFSNEEPIASSSRRIEANRTSSQLAKNFLDVIRYTMMMDEILHSTENGSNDCCKKSNTSSHLQHSCVTQMTSLDTCLTDWLQSTYNVVIKELGHCLRTY